MTNICYTDSKTWTLLCTFFTGFEKSSQLLWLFKSLVFVFSAYMLCPLEYCFCSIYAIFMLFFLVTIIKVIGMAVDSPMVEGVVCSNYPSLEPNLISALPVIPVAGSKLVRWKRAWHTDSPELGCKPVTMWGETRLNTWQYSINIFLCIYIE